MMPRLFVCLPFLLYCVLPLLSNLVFADPPYTNCGNATHNNATTHGFPPDNLNTVLGSLATNASASKSYYATTGNFPDRVYGNYMCLNYVTNKTCQDCVATAVQSIVKLCPNTKEAIVWEEECQLRYSDKEFLGKLDVTGSIGKDNVQNISQPEQFSSVLVKILKKLTYQASFDISSNKYATGEVKRDGKTIYALVQCTQDLSESDCNRCLQSAINDTLAWCNSSIGARLLSGSCYLRYELYHFYQGESGRPGSSAVNSNRTGSRSKIWMIVIPVVSSSLAVVLLSSFIYYFLKSREVQKSLTKTVSPLSNNFSSHGGSRFHFQMSSRRYEMGADEFPYIDLASLCEATENFSDSKLLGQGGFGPVYKGILCDGKEVAIKRLSTCSDQGSEEFINEVLLIKKLQHKNLVRLIGFCVDGEEKLLVYEFMPNSSLDCFLFDPAKRAELDWSRRVEIISGIAKGILYLNEDSRLKIIHRDLKASNILLDNDLNPKISDFGMARIFAGNEGEANTVTIVGTYGYMAPEYAMEGLYSTKSDVFSFGVLFLEIITGKRNAGFYHSKQAPSLLAYAWQLWTEGNGLELMDPLLSDSCDPDEFVKYMNIGLLCVQDDAHDRPTMSSVVSMLRSETTVLIQPQRPPFCVGRFAGDHANRSSTDQGSVNGLTISQTIAR